MNTLRKRALGLRQAHHGALGRKGASREGASWAPGQRLPDGMRPAAIAAPEEKQEQG